LAIGAIWAVAIKPLAETTTNMTYSNQKAGDASTCNGVKLRELCRTRGGALNGSSFGNGARMIGAISSSTTPCTMPNQKNAEA
jgi:hypothetical protein